MRNNSFARIIAVAFLAIAIAVPSFAARGSADFTHFVAIGDSISAGFGAGSLNEKHQVFSPPAIIAQQVGIPLCTPTSSAADNCFALPLISFPGLPNGEILLGVTSSGALGPVIVPGVGAPEMPGFGRPYNNLAVPGYTVGAALTLTGAEGAAAGLGVPILRGLGSEVDQAIALHPTFIMVWLGANDVLGAISQGDPTKITSTADFTTRYNAVLAKLTAGAPNAGLIVGTLPTDFRALPLTSTIPTVVFDSNFQPVSVGGQNFPLIFTPTGGTPGPVPPGSIVILSALPKIQTGVGIPPQLKPFPPFSSLPNVGTPLTDADVITPAEIAVFQTRIQEFNAAITAAAAANNAAVADVKGLYDRIAATSATSPLVVGPLGFTRQFATGGLFAMDGTHFSDIGYILFANEFIKGINSAYGTPIPLASITKAFQNNDPATAKALGLASFGPDVAAQMISIFNSVTMAAPAPPPPTRKRSIH